MYKAVAANKRNTIILMVVFAALVGAIGWVFAYLYADMSIFVWTLGIAVAYTLIQYFAANKLAVAMTGAKKVEQRSDSPRLWHVVDTLSITTGLPMPQVYVIDDPAPNAFATGRNPKHAIVAATTGLIDIMDDDELTAVMAHEMSHVQNYDIRVSMIVFGLVSAIGLITDIGVRLLLHGDDRNKHPVAMVAGLVIMILAPLIALLTRLAVSRQREYLADSSAVLITRYPDGMVRALKKLESHSKPMRKQNTATEALYINNPMKKGFINNLFSTHPPIKERVARIEKNQARF
ncbi:protease HtpX [Alphaproteobacteria bacterium]|nr:protease HtpX [Alphaproteobacteria bacterium]